MTPCRLGYWRFDSPLWIGEQGQFPSSANYVSMGTGWSGGALNVGSTANSGVTYPAVYSNGWASINCRQGTLRFWFKPNGSGGGPLVYLGNTNSSISQWSLSVGSAGNTIVFTTGSNSHTEVNLSASYNLSTSNWTQIVLNYGPSSSTLYMNGTNVEGGASVEWYPNLADRSLGMVIGNNTAYDSPINGQFDELETFNYQLSANQILTNFQTVWNIDNNLDGIPDIIQDTVLPANTPFLGQPVVVTGTIEAEQFDRGGSNVAYLNMGSNPSSSYRTTGMCITTNNMPFGYCLDQTRSNEWAKYTIDVLVPQTYAIETRVQGLGTNSVFEILFGTNNGTSLVNYTNTGPLTNTTTAWAIITGYAGLKAGTNVMTLKFLNAGISNGSPATYVGRFDYMTVYPWWQAGFTSTYTSTLANPNLITNTDTWAAASNNTYWLQRSLNDVVTHGGGTLSITNGTYFVAQISPFPNEAFDAPYNEVLGITNNNIQIQGNGISNTTLVGYNRATTIFSVGQSNNSTAQCSNVTIRDITLQAQPHLAVSNNSPTQVVYQSGMLLPTNYNRTGALVYFVGYGTLTVTNYAYDILFTNCQFINGDREIDIPAWTSNVLVQDCSFIQFQGTNGSYVPGVWNMNIPYSQPDTRSSSFMLGIFAQSDQNYNIGVVGCSYNGNPNFSNQIVANPNPTNYIANFAGAGNGFLFYQDGGNFFALRNFITNNAEEAIQFGAGPAAVAGNTFWSWADNNASCALAPNMTTANGPGATGYGFANYSVTFVGNSITGNPFGAYNDTQGVQGPYTLNFSGNSLSLFLPVSDPATNALFGSGVYIWGCQDLNVCGNAMTNGGLGVCYYGSCSNSVILANNFSGVTRGSIEDWGTGPEISSQTIGNILGRGYSYHLKAIFQEGPSWFLYNNQYVNTSAATVPIFTDSADLWAHITQ